MTNLKTPQDRAAGKWPRTNRKQPYQWDELTPDARPQSQAEPETRLGTALNGFKSRRSTGTGSHGKPAYWCLFCLTPVATASTTFCDRHRTKHQQARRRKRTIHAASQRQEHDVVLTGEQVAELTRTALVLAAKSANVAGAFTRQSEQGNTVAQFRDEHHGDLTDMFQAARTLNNLLATIARDNTPGRTPGT